MAEALPQRISRLCRCPPPIPFQNLHDRFFFVTGDRRDVGVRHSRVGELGHRRVPKRPHLDAQHIKGEGIVLEMDRRLPPAQPDVREGEIVPRAGATPFVRWGNGPLLTLCLGIVVMATVAGRLPRARRH